MRSSRVLVAVALLGCGGRGRGVAPATADQSVRDAVVLVCDAADRAEPDVGGGVTRSDAIAMHLTDGVGNNRVLTIVEGWKTDGVDLRQLDALTREAGVSTCGLRAAIKR